MWQNLKYWALLLLVCSPLAAAEERLYLEVIVNDTSSGKVIEIVHTDNNDWRLTYSDLLSLGLTLNLPATEFVLLSQIAGARANYNAELQQLFLTLPSNMLPLQRLAMRPSQDASVRAQRDHGAYVNYDFFSLAGNPRIRQSSLWHELYYFSPDFFVSSSGLLQTHIQFADEQSQTSQQLQQRQISNYTRFESAIQWDDEQALRTTAIGDVINATPNWGRSIRMGGVRFARNYELSPNLITYPLPEFYGESALPGSLSLLINDQLRLRESITSGPFLIDAMPYISGAGTAQVITTDTQGQQTKRDVNFYISSELLIPGMLDYDATLGYAREDFGLASDQYGSRPVFSGSLRYGLTPRLTPQVMLQQGDGLNLAGAGLSFLAGNLGVVELSHSYSDYQQTSGSQTGIAYNYSNSVLGVNGRYLKRRGDYYDLGNLEHSAQQNDEAQLAFSVQRRSLGTFSLGYFRISEREQPPVSLITFSWSKYFRSGLSLFLSSNHRLNSRGSDAITLAISLPLGASDSQLSAAAVRDTNSEWSQQIQTMRVAPYAGGLGWNIGADNSSNHQAFAVANWRGQQCDLAAGYYKAADEQQYSAELSGALITMDGDIYASRTVTDAFALVDTGQKDIPVMVGNKLIGTTDNHGKLLVPDLYSYLENHLSIDPLELPANVTMGSVEQNLMPRRRGGIHVKFPISFAPSAIVSIYSAPNEPIPAGAQLQTADGSQEYLAGWNGEIYVEVLDKPITLYWAEGQCQVTVTPAKDNTQALPKLGPFYCQHPEVAP